jgi:hypothetical protein
MPATALRRADLERPAIWTDAPAVRALLDQMARSEPPRRYVTGTFGPGDGEVRYCGPKVRELARLYDAAFEEACDAMDAGRISFADLEAMFPCDVQGAVERERKAA